MSRMDVEQTVFPASVFAGLFAVLAALAPLDARSQVDDCELVTTGLAEPVRFAAPAVGGGAIQVQGMLRRPTGVGNSAALIILHGHGGIGAPRCYGGATDRFTRWGYVTLSIDSQSQVYPSGVRVPEYTTAEQANHALSAASLLAALPEVDAERIGIVGWSTGGLSAIKTIASPEPQARMEPPIRAAAVIYPICPKNIHRLSAPLLILIGDRETVVSVSACRDFNADVVTGNAQLVVYPNADHMFDAPWHQAYLPSADKDAYERLRRHFEANLPTDER